MYDKVRAALTRSSMPPELPVARQAAVAAILHGPDAELLFILRATVAGDPWSGHIAFPGGRRESHDASLHDTAVRETREELGIDLSSAELLGVLDDVGPVSRKKPLVVRPFVFHVPELPAPAPNREVADVLSAPLGDLLRGVDRGTMPFEWEGHAITLPRVDLAGHRLWGMTLRMVDDLLHRVDGAGTGLSRPNENRR